MKLNELDVQIESVVGYGCDAYIESAYFIESCRYLTSDELVEFENIYSTIAEEYSYEHNSPFDNSFKDND